MKKQYDVVIIGAGVVGSAIARELSRYKLSIAVLEKNLDVCNETSGRNSAVVHGGFANPTGSLKAKCCVEGNRIMDQLAEELNFPFKRCGTMLFPPHQPWATAASLVSIAFCSSSSLLKSSLGTVYFIWTSSSNR